MRHGVAAAAAFLAALGISIGAGAQPGTGRGAAKAGAPIYDVKTVETVKGTVTEVERVPMGRRGPGVHLKVETSPGATVTVHLGPAWFVDNQEMTIAAKDEVTVKGSRVTIAGEPVLVAATVTRGDDVLTLRDEAGFPVWAAWRTSPRRGT